LNIQASNLSSEVTEEDLRTAFREYGQVTYVNIVKNRLSKASAGFGFIGMDEGAEAEAAITGLSGKTLKGQSIIVREARTRTLS
jgi:RNA recognition motif-containing protein